MDIEGCCCQPRLPMVSWTAHRTNASVLQEGMPADNVYSDILWPCGHSQKPVHRNIERKTRR